MLAGAIQALCNNWKDFCSNPIWRRSGGFIINFDDISHGFLVFLLLSLKKYVLVGLQYSSSVYL